MANDKGDCLNSFEFFFGANFLSLEFDLIFFDVIFLDAEKLKVFVELL